MINCMVMILPSGTNDHNRMLRSGLCLRNPGVYAPWLVRCGVVGGFVLISRSLEDLYK